MDESDQEQDLQNQPERKDKSIEIEQVLANIDNGTFEVFKSSSSSTAWKRFVKIRNSKSKEKVPYAQCCECRTLLNSGTTHLHRHVCKIDELAIDEDPIRELPEEKIAEIRCALIKNSMKYCAADLIPIETLGGSDNYLDYLQEFVVFGRKHRHFRLKDLHSNSNVLYQEMMSFIDEKQIEIYTKFRQALKANWCSASLEIQMTTGAVQKPLLLMKIQLFEKNFLHLH